MFVSLMGHGLVIIYYLLQYYVSQTLRTFLHESKFRPLPNVLDWFKKLISALQTLRKASPDKLDDV